MGCKKVLDDRIVQVMVGRVLVAGRDAVTGNDGAVHELGGPDHGGQGPLGIDTVNVGIVQEALALQHHDIGHARQVLEGLIIAGGHGGGLIDDCFVGGQLTGQLADCDSGLQSSHAGSFFILVLLDAFNRLHDQDQVMKF